MVFSMFVLWCLGRVEVKLSVMCLVFCLFSVLLVLVIGCGCCLVFVV